MPTHSISKPKGITDLVYGKLKLVPPGKVTTYKLLAKAVETKAYRAVGQMLARNPYAPIVPCHRVVKSDGSLGGFMGERRGKNVIRKKKMLEEEGVEFDGDRISNFEKITFKF